MGGLYGMNVGGQVGPDYELQASSDLTNWTTLLTTNPAVLPFHFEDPDPVSFSQRFYRIRLKL